MHRGAAPRPDGRPATVSAYAELLQTVRSAGLLDRRRGFYVKLLAALLVALAAVLAGVATLTDSVAVLGLAAVLGLLMAQFGFVAHEAAHREVFTSGRANDWCALLVADLVVGMSVSWWKSGHNPHHANPNVVGLDPSVERGVFSFTPEDAARSRGLGAWFTRRQGYFLFPLLLLAGVSLHVRGFTAVFARRRVEHRLLEAAMLTLRTLGGLALIGWLQPGGLALAFVAVELAVFGVATASAFVPNHLGMPIRPRDARVDFLHRQVLASRDISGGWLVTAWMGGLNYQIEHHLFPSMPRPHLAQARLLVRDYCRRHDIECTQTTLLQAYAVIVDYLNEVGLAAARDPFQCPTSSMLGR